jgi:hypothetical protein
MDEEEEEDDEDDDEEEEEEESFLVELVKIPLLVTACLKLLDSGI